MFFADAWLFWLMVPLFLGWVAMWLWRQRRQARGALSAGAPAAVRFSSLHALGRLRVPKTLVWRRAVQGLRIVVILLLMFALARPQTGRKETTVTSDGIDIMLAIDTSGSMQALDLDADRPIAQRRNRLAVVKEVVQKFIEKRSSDQIGMVVFGAEAFTQCPLTLDHGIVSTFLQSVEIGMAGDSTAIGSALGTAVARLKKSKAKSRVVILLTDGRSNAGALSPTQAAEVAKALGVKIYTIGAGTRGKAPFIQETIFGKQVVYDDVQIDEAMLQNIAQSTGGAYFRAEDENALSQIYNRIDALEKSDIEMKTYMEYNERYSWFVLAAIAVLLLEVFLLGTRFRKIP